MHKKRFFFSSAPVKELLHEFGNFSAFFYSYLKKKLITFTIFFEKNKNGLVKLFMIKRGRYNRLFLHLTTMTVLVIGVVAAPFLASTYPVFSANSSTSSKISSSAPQQSIAVGENVFQTKISQKPRDKVIEYTVEKGDTVSTIAEKFGVSTDTIRWANDLSNDNLTVGDKLKILPVTGVAYKVQKSDTVYSIAKKFDTNAQQIVDFPFNEFANPETFSLVIGQIVVVPNGVMPSQQPTYASKRQVYVAQGPVSISSSGLTWPIRGAISQFASWYHMAIDITDPVGTPVVAAQNGTVSSISAGTWDGGYGTNIWVDNGAGLATHYNHMSGVNVSAGQSVVAGKTVIGWVGMTGRTTGPHLHFEVRKNGALVNPMSYLQ